MRNALKLVFVFLFLSLLIVKPTPSYAWHGHTYVGVNLGVWPGGYYGGWPYYGYGYPYYADPYYYPAYAVAVPTSNYQPVVVNGSTYYVNNGQYYIYTAYGYQAVAVPAGAVQPAAQTTVAAVSDSDDAITVNIPNNSGGYTPVLLKKSGKGYVGPQGEFYADFPKVSQLKLMYGK